uniref:Uncharacterized protein n=1 Tax=Setaria viridis TaxID=4556 RepID=A0A4U6TUB9_SETVI|nr:hypothetical protein SEVIR_7G236532v2 [Setaria viridis]
MQILAVGRGSGGAPLVSGSSGDPAGGDPSGGSAACWLCVASAATCHSLRDGRREAHGAQASRPVRHRCTLGSRRQDPEVMRPSAKSWARCAH